MQNNNKPNWEDAPEDAKWLAKDCNGSWQVLPVVQDLQSILDKVWGKDTTDSVSKGPYEFKISPEWFDMAVKGEKRFEVAFNEYNVGDLIIMKEFANGEYTGREFGPLEIDYILRGPECGLADWVCIFTYRIAPTPMEDDRVHDLIDQVRKAVATGMPALDFLKVLKEL